ncbi:MAG: hypothetical protein ACI9WU_003870 [Myxococcota bacterium]|jgi:hypothetical protein
MKSAFVMAVFCTLGGVSAALCGLAGCKQTEQATDVLDGEPEGDQCTEDQLCPKPKECQKRVVCRALVEGGPLKCVDEEDPEKCFIGDQCKKRGNEKTDDECKICDPDRDRLDWSKSPKDSCAEKGACDDYCKEMASSCPGTYGSGCLPCSSLCRDVLDTPISATAKKHLDCRLLRAQRAADTKAGSAERDLECRLAGPTGGNYCGSWEQSYAMFGDNQKHWNQEDLCETAELPEFSELNSSASPSALAGKSVQCWLNSLANCQCGTDPGVACQDQPKDVCPAEEDVEVATFPFYDTGTTTDAPDTLQFCNGEVTRSNPAAPDSSPGSPDHIYDFKASSDVSVTVQLAPQFDAAIYAIFDCEVVSDGKAPAAQAVVAAGQTGTMTFELQGGSVAYIVVDGHECDNAAAETIEIPDRRHGAYEISVVAGPTCAGYCNIFVPHCLTEFTQEQSTRVDQCTDWCIQTGKEPGNSVAPLPGTLALHTAAAAQAAQSSNTCKDNEEISANDCFGKAVLAEKVRTHCIAAALDASTQDWLDPTSADVDDETGADDETGPDTPSDNETEEEDPCKPPWGTEDTRKPVWPVGDNCPAWKVACACP